MKPFPLPKQFLFEDDGVIPNNALPVLYYPGGLIMSDVADPAATIERCFRENGWGQGIWRNGIDHSVHYHSQTHAVFGVAIGTARVRLGGERGKELDLKPGDIFILPAGTGHECLSSTDDFLVVGGHPPEGEYDLCRGIGAERVRALRRIRRVPPAATDPIHGELGPLTELWPQPLFKKTICCAACGGPFSAKRILINGYQYHERCSVLPDAARGLVVRMQGEIDRLTALLSLDNTPEGKPAFDDVRESVLAAALEVTEDPALAHKIVARASKAFMNLPAVEQWQSIETAPKDGRFLLLICAGAWCPVVARWNGGCVNELTGEALADGWGDEAETLLLPGLNEPTHWKPLPTPPSLTRTSEQTSTPDMT